MPAPLSLWKYSWNRIKSCQCGLVVEFFRSAENGFFLICTVQKDAHEPLENFAGPILLEWKALAKSSKQESTDYHKR
jgi:hypothetical protein